MKKIILSLLVLAVLAGCSTEESITPTPVSRPDFVPEYFEQMDFSKTFIYDNAGQLTQISMVSELPNGGTMESQQNYFYDINRKLSEISTDTGFRMVYTLDNGRIVRTDEYVNCVLAQYHIYTYDSKGRLKQSTTWQNIPEEGGEIRVAKDTYEYNNQNNLTTHRLYYYTTRGTEAKILTTFTFSGYDNSINSEDYFIAIPANPLVSFRMNNPGKMVVRNRFGNISVTESYTYEYHEKGYATRKIADVVLHDGSASSYETIYRFKE